MQSRLAKQYHDVRSMFGNFAETERGPCNEVDIRRREINGEGVLEVEAFALDMFRPARFFQHVPVSTFPRSDDEEADKPEPKC